MKLKEKIHNEAMIAAKNYRASEVHLVDILAQVDREKVYRHFQYSSLFQYAVQALGLSEEVAYIFINVARKSTSIPQLRDKIAAGSISVSKAKVICAVITEQNQKHWLEVAETQTKRQIERAVALASPKHQVKEQAKLRGGAIFELKLGLAEQVMIKLRRAQDLVSQAKQQHADLSETLERVLDLYLEKKDPLCKKSKPVPGPVREGRSRLSAALRHKLFFLHQGRCAHVNESGQRCQEKRWLDVHHVVPLSAGGSNELENLTLLCRGHHLATHQSEFFGQAR